MLSLKGSKCVDKPHVTPFCNNSIPTLSGECLTIEERSFLSSGFGSCRKRTIIKPLTYTSRVDLAPCISFPISSREINSNSIESVRSVVLSPSSSKASFTK